MRGIIVVRIVAELSLMKGDEGIKTGKEITKLIYLGIVRDSNYRFPESLGVEVPNGSVAACNASRQESSIPT